MSDGSDARVALSVLSDRRGSWSPNRAVRLEWEAPTEEELGFRKYSVAT